MRWRAAVTSVEGLKLLLVALGGAPVELVVLPPR